MEKSKEKHKRGANLYERREKIVPLSTKSVGMEYSSIIDNKKTDSETIKQKKEAWKAIAVLYNQVAKTGERDWEQLRCLYDNIKRNRKKCLSEENNTKPAEEIHYIEIIKDEISSIEDEVISTEEQILSTEAEEQTVVVDQLFISNEEQGLSNEQLMPIEDQILLTEAETVPIEGLIISNEGSLLPEKEQPEPSKEKLTSSKPKTTYEDIISRKFPELNFPNRFDYLQRKKRLFKRTMSAEDLKMIYLKKKIQNANLKRQILIAEHKMQMKIFKAHLRKLKE